MKRRTWPLWLLRDVPALLGVLMSFWPLMIIVIANGRKAMAGRKVHRRVYDHIMQMLPVAEARLRYALARQAFRALGWDPRHIRPERIPMPASWAEFGERFETYRLAMCDLRAAAQSFTDNVRKSYRIRTRVDANAVRAPHASTDAAHRAAAHHEAVGVAASSCVKSQIALMVSSARSARPSNLEGVLRGARGPPAFPQFPTNQPNPTSAPPRLRSHAHVRATKSTPAHLRRGPRDDNGAEVHPTQGCGGQGRGRP